jgi:hypothetical protein
VVLIRAHLNLKALEKLNRLTKLELSNCRLTNQQLADVVDSCPRLTTLDLHGNTRWLTRYGVLAKLMALRRLNVGWCNLTDAGFQTIALSCPLLAWLSVRGCNQKRHPISFVGLGGLLYLETLDAYWCNIGDAQLVTIAAELIKAKAANAVQGKASTALRSICLRGPSKTTAKGRTTVTEALGRLECIVQFSASVSPPPLPPRRPVI